MSGGLGTVFVTYECIWGLATCIHSSLLFFRFGLAGILLTKYCPAPTLFESRATGEAASVNAHYIWYYFAAIGLIVAIALFLFAKITDFIDKKKKVCN